MAEELTVTTALTFSKDGTEISIDREDTLVDVDGDYAKRDTQSISSSAAEPVDVGDVSAGAWIMIRNRDDANYVVLQDGLAGDVFARLLPNDPWCSFRMDSTLSLYALADTADCKIEFAIIDP